MSMFYLNGDSGFTGVWSLMLSKRQEYSIILKRQLNVATARRAVRLLSGTV